jgi:serine/threonine-protein kinase
MTDSDRLFLSKVGAPRAVSAGARGLPPVLVRLAVSRVQIVAVVMLAGLLIGWVGSNVLEGEFLQEFERVGEWAPPVFMIVTSVLMLVLARWTLVAAPTLVTFALVYEVAISFGMAFSTYYDALSRVPGALINADVIGMTAVAFWMPVFTVIVPAHPRRVLVAVMVSACAVPIVYLIEMQAGRAPLIDISVYWMVFAGPYFFVAGLAYLAGRVVYRLGEDVAQAREMGSYRLVEKLGHGGMGEVWRAEHRMLARPAAVKLIRSASLGIDPSYAEMLVARFEREAQATAQLQSPHTVEVYDFGTTEDGTFYYVMELLDGVDLEHLVRRFGPLPAARVVHILRQVCASLAEAHHRGMIHRDVKPANVFLCRRALDYDFVKVLDFGLVKRHSSAGPADDLRVSQTGTIHGTPSYLAPEVASGDGAVDGRADLYALGCVAYWLLTGRLVFERDTYPAMLLAHATVEPTPPSAVVELPVPAALDAVVLACLAKEPKDRIQTAEELRRRLDKIEIQAPWTEEQAASWWQTQGLAPVGEPQRAGART